MAIQFDKYRLKNGDDIGDPRMLNDRFRDVDLRLHSQEEIEREWISALEELRRIGLDRINEVLRPAYDEIVELGQLGAIFSAHSATELIVSEGLKVITIDEADRNRFAPSAYVALFQESDLGRAMLGRVVDYDRIGGLLSVEVDRFEGGGSAAGWMISAASVTDNASAARDADQHRAEASSAAAVATEARDEAVEKALEADGHRASAFASAGAAASSAAATLAERQAAAAERSAAEAAHEQSELLRDEVVADRDKIAQDRIETLGARDAAFVYQASAAASADSAANAQAEAISARDYTIVYRDQAASREVGALAAQTGSETARDASIAAQAASEAARSATIGATSTINLLYLGAASSDPLVDLLGEPLGPAHAGAEYWNTTFGEKRIWEGVGWTVAYVPVGSEVVSVFGRSGSVTAQAGDYSADKISNLPISGLVGADVQTVLGSVKAALDDKSATSHTNAIGDVVSLQETLDIKAEADHNHALADLSDVEISGAPTGRPLVTQADGTIGYGAALDTSKLLPGSAPAPSLASVGDTDTGIFFPAADEVAAATGGVERLRIDVSGNMGIGTSAPLEKLDVVGNINVSGSVKINGLDIAGPIASQAEAEAGADNTKSMTPFRVKEAISSQTSTVFSAAGHNHTLASLSDVEIDGAPEGRPLVIQADGNIGYGSATFNPDAIGTAGTDVVEVDPTVHSFQVTLNGVECGRWTATGLGIATSTPHTSYRLHVAGSVLASGNLRVEGTQLRVAGASSAAAPSIQPGEDADTGMFWPSSNNIGFSTAGIERVRIDNAGNVGINTTSIASALHVSKQLNNRSARFQRLDSQYLDIEQDAFVNRIVSVGKNYSIGSVDAMPLNLVTDNLNRVTIDAAGDVGIGTNSPGAKLDVQGGVRISSNGALDFDSGGNFASIYQNADGLAISAYVSTADTPHILVTENGNVGIGTNSPQAKAHVNGTAIIDLHNGAQPPLNALTIYGHHIGDGNNDYGLTINSYEPAITLVDRSSGSGQSQIYGLGNGGIVLRSDPTNNDGMIGHSTNATTKDLARFEPTLHRLYVDGVEKLRVNASGGALADTWTAVTQPPGDSSTNVATTAYADAAGGAKVVAGTIMAFGAATPPIGWLACDGSAVSRTTYADLFATVGTNFGSGDGSSTFNLPDLRGEFVRGWDNERGVDDGRAFGSAQGDKFQGHHHEIFYEAGNAGKAALQASAAQFGTGTKIYAYEGGGAGAIVSDDVNGEPRLGPETRPRNIALLYCIKAFDTIDDPNLVSAAAVVADVTSNKSRLDALEAAANVSPTLTFLDSRDNGSLQSTTHVWTGVNFGTPKVDRVVLVAVGAPSSVGGAANACAGVIIGGVTATRVDLSSNQYARSAVALFAAVVPSGTTGTVTTTWSTTCAGACMIAMGVTGLPALRFFESVYSTNGSFLATKTLTLPRAIKNSLCVAAYICVIDEDVLWTGDLVEFAQHNSAVGNATLSVASLAIPNIRGSVIATATRPTAHWCSLSLTDLY